MSGSRVRDGLARLARPIRQGLFGGSARYWQERYERGGSSGVGSYGALAEFKATVLNEFVQARGVQSVIEFGCGDGNQLKLAEYPTYIGLDVAPAAIERCSETFTGDPSKSFLLYSPSHFHDPMRILRADLGLSLDVLFHLVEDYVFEKYMHDLFSASDRFVIIYSSNESLGDAAPHVRHRHFTGWVAANSPGWYLSQVVQNPHRDLAEGAVSDFFVYERA